MSNADKITNDPAYKAARSEIALVGVKRALWGIGAVVAAAATVVGAVAVAPHVAIGAAAIAVVGATATGAAMWQRHLKKGEKDLLKEAAAGKIAARATDRTTTAIERAADALMARDSQKGDDTPPVGGNPHATAAARGVVDRTTMDGGNLEITGLSSNAAGMLREAQQHQQRPTEQVTSQPPASARKMSDLPSR